MKNYYTIDDFTATAIQGCEAIITH